MHWAATLAPPGTTLLGLGHVQGAFVPVKRDPLPVTQVHVGELSKAVVLPRGQAVHVALPPEPLLLKVGGQVQTIF